MNKLLIAGVGALGLIFMSGAFSGDKEIPVIGGGEPAGFTQTTSGAISQPVKKASNGSYTTVTYNIDASSRFPETSQPIKKTTSRIPTPTRAFSEMRQSTPISKLSTYERVTGSQPISFLPALSKKSFSGYQRSALGYYSPYKSVGGFSSMY